MSPLMEQSKSRMPFALLCRDLDEVPEDLEAYFGPITDLEGQGEPTTPAFNNTYPSEKNRAILFSVFGSMGPTLVRPNDDINISWFDVLHRGLKADDFKDQGDGTYFCSLGGIWIELTREHRDMILGITSTSYLHPRRLQIQQEPRARCTPTVTLKGELHYVKKLLQILSNRVIALENQISKDADSFSPSSFDSSSDTDEDGVGDDQGHGGLELISSPTMKSEPDDITSDDDSSQSSDDSVPRQTIAYTSGSNSVKECHRRGGNDGRGCLNPNALKPSGLRFHDRESSEDSEHPARTGSARRVDSSYKPDESADSHALAHNPRGYSQQELRDGKKFVELLISTGATWNVIEKLYEDRFGVCRTHRALRGSFNIKTGPNPRLYTTEEKRDGKDFVEEQLKGGATQHQLEKRYQNKFGISRTWGSLRSSLGIKNMKSRMNFNEIEAEKSGRASKMQRRA
ncbi:unnamed protein product [Penicillium bialowiezense]